MKGLSYANITFLSQSLSKTLQIHSAVQRNVNSTNRARFTLLETTTYVYTNIDLNRSKEFGLKPKWPKQKISGGNYSNGNGFASEIHKTLNDTIHV